MKTQRQIFQLWSASVTYMFLASMQLNSALHERMHTQNAETELSSPAWEVK